MKPELHSLLARRVYWDEVAPGVSTDPLRDWDDLPFHVSIFDHWLSTEEASAIPHMFFRDAVREGVLDDYLNGERRFEAFYGELRRQGAYIGLNGRQRHFLPASSGRLARLVRDSLRERRSMDVAFVAEPIRAIGGHDRTDLLLRKPRPSRRP